MPCTIDLIELNCHLHVYCVAQCHAQSLISHCFRKFVYSCLTFLGWLWQYLVCGGPERHSPILGLTLLLRLGPLTSPHPHLPAPPCQSSLASPLLSPTRPTWREARLCTYSWQQMHKGRLHKWKSGKSVVFCQTPLSPPPVWHFFNKKIYPHFFCWKLHL